MSEPPSSPLRPGTSVEDALAWYKTQYEVLEGELSEFQASSRELEAELEKDLDAADKRERSLRQKAEGLSYEVEEWKVCPFATGIPPAGGRDGRWRLTHCAEEIQGVEVRGELGPGHTRERDHHPP
jgi:hypothetical protein